MPSGAERRLPPIQKEVLVKISPQRAFDVFTKGIATWWPLSRHSVFLENSASCSIEPRVGGEIREVAKDGSYGVWGTVLAWEPPRRFVMKWHPGSSPSQHTEVEVRFVAVAGGTRVVLEHRDWENLGARAETTRGNYDNGWVDVFERCFVEACATEA